ncbi:Biotin carboxylase [Nitrospirillum viridazoti Y2]|uniref:Biotin carboxylase n=1 Tax=Nitrospirillum amazonense TaxID=28077 RepID=A0A560GFS1_9PROT|nr:Biotin carboxylase [Nitrospirillum amazonense Y2]TWB25825.1 acetyl-CoA carboxylase biotin carboxylase subunit [Nitrospirillum amazonense]TWB32768.1 acetyl-CoA carboxylase biotin carboxylase subunit [Nitrospirillum amazonense]TWB64249.1 acetyl-CoA carboxylase biotin carboxylase subunit [Nitrospirillum amazonense]
MGGLFEKVLIANRGEIALRIHRACREMGIKTVAVHSTADADAMHVRLADESVCIGPPSAKESYLNIPAILSAAAITGADAIHPGIGFMSENAQFAQMVEEHGFAWIGPSPEHIRIMGDKVTAKRTVLELGLPVVPGSDGPVETVEAALVNAARIGYPVLIKAAAGGGGKGMKVAWAESELREAYQLARGEARAAFGNDQVYMEKYLAKPRHIEIQLLGDHHGTVVHFGERDCSIQRRHQKVVEEAPSPALNAEERAFIGNLAAKTAAAFGYRGVGTMEFLYENGQFYFIEMNTRLQIEHTISEMVTGVDLVREQIRVATGAPLGYGQDDIKFNGHSIECRVNAENPVTFAPSPGRIDGYHAPGGLGVRVDSALYDGYRVPPHYDSMIAKLIVHGNSRNECLMRLRRAIEEFVIGGIDTTLPLHQRIIAQPDFINGDYDIRWLEEWMKNQPAG